VHTPSPRGCLQASKRQNPTIVSFNGVERFIGEPAVTQVRMRREPAAAAAECGAARRGAAAVRLVCAQSPAQACPRAC
jgi:hypothetical protein